MRKNEMLTKIDFKFEIDIPGPSTTQLRKRLVHSHTIEQARKHLSKKNAEKGKQWDFTVKVEETLCSNGQLIGNYTDEFSLVS